MKLAITLLPFLEKCGELATKSPVEMQHYSVSTRISRKQENQQEAGDRGKRSRGK
jgi:hypothetical protein